MPLLRSIMNILTLLRRLLDRWAERLQHRLHSYEGSLLPQTPLDAGECDLLQGLTEGRTWEVLKRIRDAVNVERHRRAHAFCDGRSFVEYKKVDGLDEFLAHVENIVGMHKQREEPILEPEAFPKKLAEYVP